jgi:hypothetical protein
LHKTRITYIGLFALIAASAGLSVWKNDVSGFSIDVIYYPSTPTLHNLAGEKISTIEVGQQSMIRISVHNNNPAEQPFLLLVEVRNGYGVTEYLAWQSGVAEANGNYTMETLWTPNAHCGIPPNEECRNYTIRSFAITSLQNPQILSPVFETDGITLSGSPPIQNPGHYSLSLNNQTFQIDYSFSRGGRITQIEAADETESMTFSLLTPRDSRLSITMPEELMQHIFPNILATGDELVVFVDEVPVDMNQTIDSRTGSFTFVMPIEQGSEQLELVGTWLI